jgi:hypothetical protein
MRGRSHFSCGGPSMRQSCSSLLCATSERLRLSADTPELDDADERRPYQPGARFALGKAGAATPGGARSQVRPLRARRRCDRGAPVCDEAVVAESELSTRSVPQYGTCIQSPTTEELRPEVTF